MDNFYNDVIVKLCHNILSEPIMENVKEIINSSVTYNDYQHLWKDYLQSLQSSGEDYVAFKLALDAYNGSFFDYLQKNSDLEYDNSYIYNFLKKFNELGENEVLPTEELFWNESINDLIKVFGQMYDIDENGNITFKLNQEVKLFGDTSIALEEIRKADAGFSFDVDPYVRPNINVDKQIYADLRIQGEEAELGTLNDIRDFVRFMLNKDENLQFTQSPPALEKNKNLIGQLRLIMPKYSHRVSVEDLNRNFWVIGQVLSGVCAYLFNDDSPLSKFFKKAVSELAELWENMLYLWSAIATESQEDVRSLHVEHLLMPINEFQNKKYDDTGSPFNLNDWIRYQKEGSKILDSSCNLIKNLKYLKYKYPKSQLCIIPFLREDYYKIEHYKGQRYFGIVFYDRFKDEWSFIPINFEGGDLKISIDEVNSTQIGCLRKDSVGYLYAYPFSDIETEVMATPQQEYFYAMLRLDLDIKVKYDGEFIISGFNIKTYDAATEAVDNTTEKWIDNYYNNDEIKINDIDMITVQRETISIEKSIMPVSERNFNYGFYTGELISNYKQTLSKEPAKFVTLKIGAMMPMGIDELDEYGNNKGAKLYENAEFRENLQYTGDPNEELNKAYKEAVYGYFDLHLGHYKVPKNQSDGLTVFNSYLIDENTNRNKVKFMAFASVQKCINPETGEEYGENYDKPVNLINLNQSENQYYYNCSKNSHLQPHWVDYANINNDYLKALGSQMVEIYCKNFYNKDEKRMFFITKMSGRYWMGANGSQWSWGRYCHMFVASQNPNSASGFDIECVGLVNKNKIYNDMNEDDKLDDEKVQQREKYFGGLLDKPFVTTNALDSDVETREQVINGQTRSYFVNKGTNEKVMQDYTRAYFSDSQSVNYDGAIIQTTWRQVTFYANLVSYKIINNKGQYVFLSPYLTIKDYNKIYYKRNSVFPDSTIVSPINTAESENYEEWTEIAHCKLDIHQEDNEYVINFINHPLNQMRVMHCTMDGVSRSSNNDLPMAVDDRIAYANKNGFLYTLTENGRISKKAWNTLRLSRPDNQNWDYDIYGRVPTQPIEEDLDYAVSTIINHTAPLTVFRENNQYEELDGQSYIIY